MKKKEPIRIFHMYLTYFQEDKINGRLKQINFRLQSLSFLKVQLQNKERSTKQS